MKRALYDIGGIEVESKTEKHVIREGGYRKGPGRRFGNLPA